MRGFDQRHSRICCTTGSEATAIDELAGRCHPNRGQSRKSSGESRVNFADVVVVVVVFVEGARLDLSTLIARFEVYKLDIGGERVRRSSYRQRLWWYEYETGERRVLERTHGCSSPLKLQGTVSSRRDGGRCVAVKDGERTCPRPGRKKLLKYSKYTRFRNP